MYNKKRKVSLIKLGDVIMGKLKDFINVFLNPEKEVTSLEEAIKESNINPKDAKLLLATAGGIKWTGYGEKEDIKTELKEKFGSKVNKQKTQNIDSKTKSRNKAEKER